MSACLNKFHQNTARTKLPFLNQPCARTGLPFLLLANQAGLLHHATMASSGVTPDPLSPGATSAFATAHWMKKPLGIIRKASPDDVQQLVALMAEFYAEGGYPLNRRHATEAFAALLADDRLGVVWFIQADSRDVGHVVVTLCFSMEYGGLIAFVDDLFIQQAFRRAGLGTAALAEVLGVCGQRGVRALFVETGRDNVPAQALYRRAGFVDTDRQLLALRLADPTHVGEDSTVATES